MKVEELRGKKPEQLKADLAELKKEAFNLRFQLASGELNNSARIRQVRRDIARVKTVLSEQRLAPAA